MKRFLTLALLAAFLTPNLWAYDLDESHGLFKTNYALPAAYEPESPEGRKDEEAKFQISLYQRILNTRQGRLFFAYSQTSWWQLYDQADSRPFRETNYNPEFFWATPPLDSLWGQPWMHLGYEHQSNGGREPYSRSWDRLYVRYGLEWKGLRWRHKIFYRLPEQAKEYPEDPSGDENPDIVEHYGINEYELMVPFGDFEAYGKFRYNLAEQKGSSELNLTYPVGLEDIYIIFQYFQGYGESLIDYDRNLTKFGIGFSLNRT